MGKASTKAQNKYIAKAYDRVNLTLPKGRKAELQAYVKQRGESLNSFIGRAIEQLIKCDSVKSSAVSDSSLSIIPPETMEAAAKAANTTGEDVFSFIARAVQMQAKRDQATIDFGINPVTGEKMD